MNQFRLKKEAVPFILEKHATAIYDLDTWADMQIDIKALEEVQSPFITFGIKNLSNGSSLCGWKENSGHFHFTINFPSMKHQEYDKFNKGHMTREFMDKIQGMADYFFQDFVNDI